MQEKNVFLLCIESVVSGSVLYHSHPWHGHPFGPDKIGTQDRLGRAINQCTGCPPRCARRGGEARATYKDKVHQVICGQQEKERLQYGYENLSFEI